jgi:heat shock protein HslJ
MRTLLPALIVPGLVAMAMLPGCRAQRQQLGQAMSGKPPVIAGSLEGQWVLADLNGGGTPAAAITLLFDPGDHNTSRVSGSSGCNRFTGGWQQDGATLKLGKFASTMMACPPAVMEVERRFLATLETVTGVTYTTAGEAILSAPDGRKLLLRRPPKPAE